MGSGTPVLTVNALSTKLDGITPFISPVLLESQQHGLPICNVFKALMITPHADESSRKPGMYFFGGYAEIPMYGKEVAHPSLTVHVPPMDPGRLHWAEALRAPCPAGPAVRGGLMPACLIGGC